MKGYRFYKWIEEDSCVALILEDGKPVVMDAYKTVLAFFPMEEIKNPRVARGYVSEEWIATECQRVREEIARKLHPALFEKIDMLASKVTNVIQNSDISNMTGL